MNGTRPTVMAEDLLNLFQVFVYDDETNTYNTSPEVTKVVENIPIRLGKIVSFTIGDKVQTLYYKFPLKKLYHVFHEIVTELEKCHEELEHEDENNLSIDKRLELRLRMNMYSNYLDFINEIRVDAYYINIALKKLAGVEDAEELALEELPPQEAGELSE